MSKALIVDKQGIIKDYIQYEKKIKIYEEALKEISDAIEDSSGDDISCDAYVYCANIADDALEEASKYE